MTLANGRSYRAIPGPSETPDAVQRAMHRSSVNIYEGEIVDLTRGLVTDLRRVARTEHHLAMYICNGHGAWEAALANVVAPGDLVLVPATGRFSHGWAEMAEGLGIEVEIIDFGLQSPFDLTRIEDRLRDDPHGRIKAVLAVHVDTATSVRNDIPGLRAAMDAAGHPALLMADCVASLGCDRFEMDAWGVDVMVTGSQKGLMVPPGMGFVFFSPKAAAHRPERVSRYWDWAPRANPEQYYQYFGGTAPTLHLYGLRVALDMMMAEGMEAIWHRHATLARAIWAAVEHWGQEGPLRLNIADPAHRSHAVTALALTSPQGQRLRDWCEQNAGVTLGIGLGMAPPDSEERHGFFRIGHMGHVNSHMVLGVLGAIEAGLAALAIPHRPGGIQAATQVISAAAPPAS
ncbi:pyridoxal-phosphate-dependent aminotransferase family protein [Marinovum sp.]|uniref:pyridoxal-phosphate-dependent aminotransferase family protein n=1 Tax=Marinovum sp. TaxID=2024839 RepID=UPI003A9388B0